MSRQCCQGREGDITMAKLGHSASLSGSFELLPNVLVDADHQTKYRQNHHCHHHNFFFVTTNTIKTVNMLMTCVCFWVCVKKIPERGKYFHIVIIATFTITTTISIILTCGGFVGFGWNKFHSGVRLIVKEGIWLQQEGT